MSRTLNDDFEDDALPDGALDLEKGSGQVGSGVASSYGSDGIDFDDELDGDAPGGGALELDLPGDAHASRRGPAPPPPPHPQHANPAGAPSRPDLSSEAARESGDHAGAEAPGAPPAPSSERGAGTPVAATSTGSDPAAQQAPAFSPLLAMAKPTPAQMIAKYPAPPGPISQAPMYAVRVVIRQLELRSELESLRRRRSPDVPLYEAALRAYDVRTFRLGMAINCALLTVATFIFFLPVILRFARAE